MEKNYDIETCDSIVSLSLILRQKARVFVTPIFQVSQKNVQGKTLQLISPGANIIKKFTAGKLQIFIINKPFQDGMVFAGKARAYPTVTPFSCSTLGQASGLANKQQTRLERLARSKHFRILSKFVTYGRKKFIKLAPEHKLL